MLGYVLIVEVMRRHESVSWSFSWYINPKIAAQAFNNRKSQTVSTAIPELYHGYFSAISQLFRSHHQLQSWLKVTCIKAVWQLSAPEGSFGLRYVHCFMSCFSSRRVCTPWQSRKHAARVASSASSACWWQGASTVILQWQTMSQLGSAWEEAPTKRGTAGRMET